ncbi:haloacid dehalogenase type II, partial [Singulisphaera rosea]
VVVLATTTACAPGLAQEPSRPRFKAIAFDYFVLFDQSAILREAEAAFPGKGAALMKAWREKQYEYTFLRSASGRHIDYFKLAEDALIYTARSAKLDLSSETRRKLLDAFLALKPWPDTADALRKLKASGVRIIILSNLSPKIIRTNVERAGFADLFDEMLSSEANGTFKPDPKAYALGTERLKLPKGDVAFAASAGWDAFGAKSFGYPTYWVNRLNLPPEELDVKADATSNRMEGLLEFVLGKP